MPDGLSEPRPRGAFATLRARWWLGLLLPLGIALQRLGAAHPEALERLWVAGLYPWVARAQRVLFGSLFGALPVSGAELLLLGAIAWLVSAGWRGVGRARRREATWGRVLLAGLATLWALAGCVAATFLFLWGFHYARAPLEQRLGWELDDVEGAEVLALCEELVQEVNALRPALAEDAQGVLRLDREACLERSRAVVGSAGSLGLLDGAPARPRRALLSPAMSRLGITGIYSPFTGEPHVNAEVTDAELPFTALHEVAHALGHAREDEANLVAALACALHPDPAFRYSGALASLRYGLFDLGRSGRGESVRRLVEGLTPGVWRDVEAIDERVRRLHSVVTELSAEVNDAYLRTQGDARGVRSYGRVVRLLVGLRRAGVLTRPR